MLKHSGTHYTDGLAARMHDPAQLLRRDLSVAALIDLGLALDWLAAVIVQARARVHWLLGLFNLRAATLTFIRHSADYAPPAQPTLVFSTPAEFAREHGLKPVPQGTILPDIGNGVKI